MSRRNLSQRSRFEILKRDGFRCGYCGKQPPEVVLEVDHIQPVADGGTNDPVNLITSCHACNAGKSSILLTQKAPSQAATAKLEKDRLEQMAELNRWLHEKNKVIDGWVNQVSDVWIEESGEDPSKWRVSAEVEKSIRRFLKFLPCEEVKDSVRIALSERRFGRDGPLRYFCGVCWTKIRDADKASVLREMEHSNHQPREEVADKRRESGGEKV